MKLIIAGSREFKDYLLLKQKLSTILSNTPYSSITVVCGEANGADRLGKQWALEHGIDVISMPADWDHYGKSAGYIRNEEMAKVSTHCILFWDGISKGTKHMLDLAKKYKLNLRVVIV